ncbi:YdcF family protein [Nocardia puris]|uniref:YdcF family protein n=1 Tax=Nocardia puris TaxID=208602 RepID=UPI000A0378AC|nr:YdcF family protein [Nocardia puris]MBF6209831.1 YdcF family protein [Nocardia puris]MBF6366403.1 YdcF family protein [Nocardia puris]MBF6458258.1 YdcF family protein [Nocardia puris]
MKISRHWKTLVAAAFATVTLTGVLGAPAQAAPDTDALYNSAQRHFTDGNDAAGRADLRALIDADPADADALALQAIWSHYAGDIPAFADAMGRLAAVDPAKKAGTDNVIHAVTAAAGTLPNPLPALVGPQTGIVVLGYGLLPDGALRPELVNRLTAAWLQAVASPFSPIVLTGGNPRNGIAEADAMAHWLIGRGIPASRIHIENRAGSTVQNALFSTRILRDIGATSAVVVTSPNHIRRAVADFIVAGTRVVGATTSLEQLVSQLPPPPRHAQRGIYLDATRTFQLATSR